jgi:hypothetical protein
VDETQDDRSTAIETDRSLFPLLHVVSRALATTSSTLIFWLLALSSLYIYPPSTYIYCFFSSAMSLGMSGYSTLELAHARPPSSNCGPSTSVKLLEVLSTW